MSLVFKRPEAKWALNHEDTGMGSFLATVTVCYMEISSLCVRFCYHCGQDLKKIEPSLTFFCTAIVSTRP
jgi:hypothetical protein